ncbi:MAG: hypothetical protein PHP42_07350 [Bacteroidota bacterium]|nr:hypothetical protein [Bacteroidota bacterium]
MGQQQLLLIILGVIIVGIAVAVGITMFQDNAVSANRDAVTNDLVQLAAKAQQYFRKPVALGGGGNTFGTATGATPLTADAAGMAVLVSTAFSNNDNGTYTISTAGTAGAIIFQGVGKTDMGGGVYPTFLCTVSAAGYQISKIN